MHSKYNFEYLDTLECNGRGGQCKSSCEESEEDTGSCCKEYRCCQPMTSCNGE